ncbi:MAG TPA: YncE family protein [Candidatus Dormibacteraeota bacterium]|jgi:DNA-binding beta-propeller fold protein YncE|nr:YncE family protein [Candidatus Dormibacteraeota bacterium]
MKSGVVLATILGLLSLGASPSGYQVSKKVPLPGAGGWDYLTVDENARRIYVSHATQVVVLDADSLEVVGTIPGLAGVHGIALAPEFGRGYITSGQTDSVAVFDLKSLKKTEEVKVGKKPDAIVYDSATKQVFAMNGDGESSTAISAADNRVVGTVALGGGPEFTIADGKGNVFVNLEDKSELLRIDAKALQVKNRWPVAPCEAPSSMAFDDANSRLFLGCRSKVMAVVDSNSGKVVATFPIGDKADASVFDRAGKIAFTSTGDGHIYGFHQDSADSYTPLPVINTATGSKTMTMDQKTRALYVPVREKDAISLWVIQP